MPEIMTTKELGKYLRLHQITICKLAAEGKIPAVRVGRVWRFDKEVIDKLISEGQAKNVPKGRKNKPFNQGSIRSGRFGQKEERNEQRRFGEIGF